MRVRKSTSIKRKLLLISLVTTGLALLLASTAFVTDDIRRYRRFLVETLTVQAQSIGSNSAVGLAFDNKKDVETILGSLSAAPNIIQAVIYTQNRTVFASYQRHGVAGQPVNPGVETDRSWFENNRLFVIKPIMLDGETIGSIFVQSDLKEFYVGMAWNVVITLMVFGGSMVVAFLVFSRMQKAISGPILELALLTKNVSVEKDYSVRCAVQSDDELGSLAGGMNEMLSQIQSRDQELELHRQNLEKQVAARTAELGKANAQLQLELLERRNAELKLQRYASELKQSNEEVLSFAYIVSHDLRAPLVSIKGFAGELQYALQEIESVLDRCMPHLSGEERTKLAETYRKDVPVAMDFIKSSVGRMDGLINAVLVLSRLGHRELKPEPIDMREVAKSILSSLAHQIEQRKTIVTIGELPTITADKLAMEQIMGNLLDNALKYLEPVREGLIAVTAENDGEEIVFRVMDNGRGIAQEDMHKVFEIFRRAGKQDVPGEGMGLAYVKTLVRRQGGRIWCESEPGKGTTFNFTIPHSAVASI